MPALRVDRPRDELAATIAAEGSYDLMVDHLWGAPAEAVFAALIRAGGQADGAQRTRTSSSGWSPASWRPCRPGHCASDPSN